MPKTKYYSNTRMSNFRRCTWRYYQIYGLEQPVFEEEKRGLAIGSAGHAALRAWYEGKGLKTALDWAYEEFSPADEADLEDFEALTATLRFYFERVRDNWKIQEVEVKLVDGSLKGIIDLIVQDSTGKTLIVDHKFQRSKQVSHLPTDTQVSLYLLLAKRLGKPVDGMLYNIIPTGEEPTYPIRRMCTRSPAFLRNFEEEVNLQIKLMQEFDSNPRPIRNFTRDCVWDCTIYHECLRRMNV